MSEVKVTMELLDEIELLRKVRNVCGEIWAAMWDGHYGKGLSADRCRMHDRQLREVGFVGSRDSMQIEPPADWTPEETQ